MPTAAPSRILIAEFDSTAQADRFARAGKRPGDAINQLTGMLRTGVLISANVLLTDAMLLDGAYFMRLGPEGVLRELGSTPARYPITVTGFAPTLREGLDARLANPAFIWSLAGVEHGRTPPRWVEDTWEAWIRLVDDGVIHYEQQAGAQPQMLSIDHPQFAHGAPDELIDALIAEPKRSEAWGLLDAALLDETIEAESHATLKRWWNAGYSLLLAERTGADWLSFESGTVSSDASRTGEIHLPRKLVNWARESSSATIALAWDVSSRQRERLHEKPSWARMRDLAYATTRVTTASSRRGVLVDSVLKLAVAGLIILLAVPGWEADTLDNPFTWLAFAGVIITTLPFDALFALRELLVRDERTSLILHGAGQNNEAGDRETPGPGAHELIGAGA